MLPLVPRLETTAIVVAVLVVAVLVVACSEVEDAADDVGATPVVVGASVSIVVVDSGIGVGAGVGAGVGVGVGAGVDPGGVVGLGAEVGSPDVTSNVSEGVKLNGGVTNGGGSYARTRNVKESSRASIKEVYCRQRRQWCRPYLRRTFRLINFERRI